MTHVQFSPNESGHSPIASQFVVAYYQKTLKRDYSALRDYYGEHSILSFARLHQDQTSCIGPEAIVQQLNTFTESLGKFKLDISTVDAVPAGSTIVITCSGSIFTAAQEDVFSHTFVLVPTQGRKDCYYILVEAFRVLSSEKEAEASTVTPPNATSAAPSNPFANAAPAATVAPEAPAKPEKETAFSDRWNNAAGKSDETKVAPEETAKPAAEVTEAPPAQHERKHRERKPRQENNTNVSENNTQHNIKEAPVSETKPSEPSSSSGITDRAVAWTEAADRQHERPAAHQQTHPRKEYKRHTLGLIGLDRATTMDEVWYACARMGKIKQIRWWGEDNAAVEMRYEEDAEKMCSATFRFKIKNRVVKVEVIPPEQYDELPRE